ncbi:MAG: type IV pilus secretin PilQ [Candidatus Binatia bacterium]
MNARKNFWIAALLATALATGSAFAEFPRGVVSLDLRDADVRDVIWAFAKEHKLNVVIGEDVHGKVTLTLRNVALRAAFDSILDNAGLGVRQAGPIFRVNSLETIKKNQAIEPLVTRVVGLNYFTTTYGGTASTTGNTGSIGGLSSGGQGSSAGSNTATQTDDLTQLKQALEAHLSGVGGASVTVVPRTNSLVITDIASNVDRLIEMAKRLDVETPQVLIEAKIVEVDASYSRELGITTNFNSARTKNTRVGGGGGANFATSGGSIGPNGAILSELGSSAFNFFLNSLGAGDVTNLQVILNAAETNGLARTLGTPRVTTLNNKEAIVTSGQRIPFSTLGSIQAQGGTQLVATVQFVDAALQLAVTPHVTGNNSVMMKVRATRNTADFDNTVFDNPTITTREALNEVLVDDGETVVIGGIYTSDSSTDSSGTPFLKDVPVLGHLFKNDVKSRDTRELIFLITPRVVKTASIIRPKNNPSSPDDSLALGAAPFARTVQ